MSGDKKTIPQREQQGYRSILTGAAGELCIAQLFLHWGWLPRKQDLDQGIDYIVEVGHEGRGAGVHFLVQSKATAGRPRITAEHISVPLKGSNVEYLLKQTLPILLMFVTTLDDSIYWIDAGTALKSAARKSNGNALIKIPLRNFLRRDRAGADLNRDRESILKLVRPTPTWSLPAPSVEETIRADEEKLSSLDPSFRVRITATGEGRVINISPNRDESSISIGGSFRFMAAEDSERLAESISYGVPTEINVRSLSLKGSPLFEKLTAGGRNGRLRLSGKVLGNVYVKLSSGSPRGRTLRFAGEAMMGTIGGDAALAARDHPLRARFRVHLQERKGTFNLELDPLLWRGTPLKDLDRLEEARECLDEIAERKRMHALVSVRGQRLNFDEQVPDEDAEVMLKVSSILGEVDDLRELALRYRPGLLFGDAAMCGKDEATTWKLARRLLNGELVCDRVSTATFVALKNGTSDRLFNDGGVLTCNDAPFVVTAFGERLCEIPIDYYLEDFDIQTSDTGSGELHVVCRIRDQSKSLMRLASREPWSRSLRPRLTDTKSDPGQP